MAVTPSQQKLAEYGEIKSPVVPTSDTIEGGAIRPGGAPSLYSREYLGLLVHVAAVGVVYGTIYEVTYSVLNNYLQMSATMTATATALVRVPRTMQMVAALITDCYPIFGYRRRPYMILGWGIAFICCFVMAVLSLGEPYYTDSSLINMSLDEMTADQLATINYDAPDKGVRLIILMMLANMGIVLAFGAADGFTIELAQREPENIRGSIQSRVAGTRQIFLCISAFMSGIALNGEDYGGDFSWTMGFNAIMGVCAGFSLLAIPFCWYCITEQKKERKSMRTALAYLYDIVQNRVIYQVIAFRFFRQVFSLITVTAASPIQSTWAKVTPLNSGLASIFGYLVTFGALYVVRKQGLHWNWRVVVVVCTFGVVLIDMIPTFITIWDVYRSQWFWLGVPLVEVIPDKMSDFITTLFVAEITDEGHEATIQGMITSVSSLGSPFATVITKSVDSYFDIERAYIKKDDHHVRTEATYAYLIAYLFNLFSCVFVLWLPKQKAEARALKENGGKTKWLGVLTIAYTLFAFAWTIMTNLLSLWESTSCLRIAGGTGC